VYSPLPLITVIIYPLWQNSTFFKDDVHDV